ncbi:MAG TPA: nucleotide sugar dehydrogenase, partial [Clostridiaceae bacterium]|nr:nucleotide sugar dehydrogenase [Clostridiaceae bacterium]
VEAYDPVVPSKYDFKVNSLKQAVSDKDAVMILAKQKEFDDLNIDDLIKNLKPGTIILDTRNLFSKYVSKFKKNNIIYKSL